MDGTKIGNGRTVTRTRLESSESLMGADGKPDICAESHERSP